MSPLLASLLLVCALVLPFAGALALRTFGERLTQPQQYGAVAAVLLIAFVSVLALARGNIDRLQIGNLTLLLPLSAPIDEPLPPIPTSPPPPSVVATAAVTPAPTAAPTEEPTALPTEEPTATPEPPTPEPPTATPEPPTPEPAQPALRTYRVESGDTLRGIAEQFGVSVQAIIEANNLTPEQADALQVGRELVIP
ncbi:MAG TPA: LysM peptidoglycan-binding domain-containing protein [Roseiflexaceae bacterium]|nr:LysM peptidoglycan-binding domain-containing protein [Roseiflexaceae bacterium]